MREQVRLWFYSMLFMSVVLEDRAPYDRVLSYNTVVSEDGSKFSKTGFMIKFDEAAEKNRRWIPSVICMRVRRWQTMFALAIIWGRSAPKAAFLLEYFHLFQHLCADR